MVCAWWAEAVKTILPEFGMQRGSNAQCGAWVKLPYTMRAFVPSEFVDHRPM